MPTVKITLYQDEREALGELARAEKRDPRAQAAIVIRDYLIRMGHLPGKDSNKDASNVTA